jgi:hypothetical protein
MDYFCQRHQVSLHVNLQRPREYDCHVHMLITEFIRTVPEQNSVVSVSMQKVMYTICTNCLAHGIGVCLCLNMNHVITLIVSEHPDFHQV